MKIQTVKMLPGGMAVLDGTMSDMLDDMSKIVEMSEDGGLEKWLIEEHDNIHICQTLYKGMKDIAEENGDIKILLASKLFENIVKVELMHLSAKLAKDEYEDDVKGRVMSTIVCGLFNEGHMEKGINN